MESEGAHYALESRGITEIKGKGLMETFFVESVYDPAVGRGINGAVDGVGDNPGAESGGGSGPGSASEGSSMQGSSICELQ